MFCVINYFKFRIIFKKKCFGIIYQDPTIDPGSAPFPFQLHFLLQYELCMSSSSLVVIRACHKARSSVTQFNYQSALSVSSIR